MRLSGMQFGAFQIVPPVAVPVARQILSSQGLDPSMLHQQGEISATDLMSIAFEDIEIRTALTSPVKFKLREPPDPRTTALLNEIRPVVVMTGRAGRVEIAPYGTAGGPSQELKETALKAAAGIALGLFGFYLVKRALTG